jgi:hypothetical protein
VAALLILSNRDDKGEASSYYPEKGGMAYTARREINGMLTW